MVKRVFFQSKQPESCCIICATAAQNNTSYSITVGYYATFHNFKKTYASDNVVHQEEANITPARSQPNKVSDEQGMNFIPFQIVPLVQSESPDDIFMYPFQTFLIMVIEFASINNN